MRYPSNLLHAVNSSRVSTEQENKKNINCIGKTVEIEKFGTQLQTFANFIPECCFIKKNQKNPECCQTFAFFSAYIKEISVGFGNYGNLIRD